RAKGLSEGDAERGARLYGSEAIAVYTLPDPVAAEAHHAVLHEGAVTLEDYWVRRSARARFDDEGGLGALEPAARAMASLLGWNTETEQQQVRACRELREREMAAARESKATS